MIGIILHFSLPPQNYQKKNAQRVRKLKKNSERCAGINLRLKKFL